MSNKKWEQFRGQYDKYSTESNPTSDAQMQDYFENQNVLLGDLVASGLTWQKQTNYALGAELRLGNGLYAICTTAGTSGLNEPTWAAGEVTDNTVTWNVGEKLEQNQGTSNEGKTMVIGPDGRLVPSATATFIKRNTAYVVDALVCSTQLGAGRYLQCTVAGTTAATEPVISGETVVDGTSTWKVVTSGGGGGEGTWGLIPNPVTHRRKIVDATTVTLYWRDPENAYIDGVTMFEWLKTVIVKKQNSLPESPTDGTVVVTSTTRNQYYNNGFVDNQANGDSWYYRAFTYSTGGLYSKSRLNDFQFWLFGVCVDESISDPATMCTPVPGTDNFYYNKPAMDFANDTFDYGGWLKWENIPFGGKPCMLKRDGTVDYYLNPDDLTKKMDGTASDVTNSSYNGNAMIEFPQMWFRCYKSGTKIYKLLCSERLENSYDAYSWMNSDGTTYRKYKYRAIFEGTNVGSKLKSYSSGSRPTASLTMTNEMAYARANGTGYTCTTWALERVLIAAFQIIFMNNNGQAVLGSAPTSSSALTLNCGAGNTKGPMYGSTSGVTKFLGMENPWSHRWRRFEGMTTISLQYYVKMTIHRGDGSTADDYNTTGTGYIATGVYIPSGASSSYIKNTSGEQKTAELPVIASGGSSTTYYCDACWSGASPCGPFLGGAVSDGVAAGPFALHCAGAPSGSAWNVGASLEF